MSNHDGVEPPFKSNKAGDEWLKDFMVRNPDLSFPTSRCYPFNKWHVDHFYDNLWQVMEK